MRTTRSNTNRLSSIALITLFAVGAATGGAYAQGPIDIGGKTAMVVNGAIDSGNDGTSLSLNIEGTYVFPGGTYEVGAGIGFFGTGVGKDGGIGSISPNVTARINSPMIGPEENILFYAGANLGFTVTIIDQPITSEVTRETDASGGPRFGVEYYFSPQIAVQLEDRITFSKDPAGDNTTDNRISVGVRLLF